MFHPIPPLFSMLNCWKYIKKDSHFLGIFLILCFLLGCKGRQECDVPSYPVVFDMNIFSQYPHFVPGNGFQTMTFTQKRYERDLIGYAGLLVWVDMEGKYNACDLCCPHCLDRNKPVYTDGIYAVCPECGEEYDLSYGLAVPQHGISRQALRRFSTSYRNGVLVIRN